LAEVFLVKALRLAVFIESSVEARDQQVGTTRNFAAFHRSHHEPDRCSKRHHERLVFRRSLEAGYRRFQDVRGRLTRRGQGNLALHKHNRQLGLRAGERKPQPFAAGKEGALRKIVQHLKESVFVEWLRFQIRVDPRRLALEHQRQGTGNVTTNLREQTKVILFRNPQSTRNRVALSIFGKQAGEEWSTSNRDSASCSGCK